MSEDKKDEVTPQKEEMSEEGMSRRKFIGATGAIIGLGMLSRFSLIGAANASDYPVEIIPFGRQCTGQNVCRTSNYTCTTASPHSCNGSAVFDCISTGNQFQCNPAASNNCQVAANNRTE